MTARARLPWLLTALGAALAAAVLARGLPPTLTRPCPPLVPVCTVLALAAAVGGIFPRTAPAAHTVLSSARLTLVLLLDLAWVSEGRDLWAALAVYTALHDAELRASPFPLVPPAVALSVAVGWTATTPDVAPARAVLLGLVTAAAAAWGDARGRS